MSYSKDFFIEDRNQFRKKFIVKNNKLLQFDISKGIERLLIQRNGDVAFYYLAILSFIEGFFRDKYKNDNPAMDFDSENSISLSEMFDYIKKQNQPLSRENKRLLNYIYFFTRLKGKSSTDLFITGDRIRHCFVEQDKRNVSALLGNFLDFSKAFGFYESNKEKLEKLLHDDRYFSHQKNRTPDKENDQMVEIGPHCIRLMNEGTVEEKEAASELFDEIQEQQSVYIASWRNYQQMMATLTDEQEAISGEILQKIQNDDPISLLVKGGPGTGKTLILINVLQQTLEKDIRLLTYTNSLTKYNKYLANLVSFNGLALSQQDKEELLDRIECFDDFFSSLAKKLVNKEVQQLDAPVFSDVIETCAKNHDMSKDDLVYAAKEIWSHLPEKSKYINLTYAQTTPAEPETQERRNKFWNAVEELKTVLRYKTAYPSELFFYNIWKGDIQVDDNLKLDYLLIDEIQDLPEAKIEAVRKICKRGFILTGDKTQSVFIRKALPWLWFSKNKRLVSIPQTLSKNFRSSLPIQSLVNKYREKITIKDEETITEAFMPGPLPESYLSKTPETAYQKVQERIQFLKERLYFDSKDICIVAPSNNTLEQLQESLHAVSISSTFIEDNSFDFNADNDAVKLSRVKYVKGIDFPVIILILDKSFIDKTKNDNLDIHGQENGIYTSISRAMNMLCVFFIDDGELLQQPEAHQKTNAVYKLFQVMDDVINLDT